MSKKHEDIRSQITERIKGTPQPPVQKVVLVEKESRKDAQLNVLIKPELLAALKIHGIKVDKSVKQMVSEAIQAYIDGDTSP